VRTIDELEPDKTYRLAMSYAGLPAYDPAAFRVAEPKTPRFPAEDLNYLVPYNQKLTYNMDEVVARLVDNSEHTEFRPDYGPEIRVELVPRSYKPPMEELPASKHYQKLVSEAGAEMGIDIEFVTGAGGSDGNWIGSVGVPVLDALSGVGKGAHSQSEYIEIEPTFKRIELFERILRKLIADKEA